MWFEVELSLDRACKRPNSHSLSVPFYPIGLL